MQVICEKYKIIKNAKGFDCSKTCEHAIPHEFIDGECNKDYYYADCGYCSSVPLRKQKLKKLLKLNGIK